MKPSQLIHIPNSRSQKARISRRNAYFADRSGPSGSGYYFLILFFVAYFSGCTTRLSHAPIGSENDAALPAGTFRLSPKNTRITFIGTAIANSHEGTFTRFTGRLTWPNDAHLSVEIQMNSVFTKIDLLTRHLKESDYFDVVQFPTAGFESTQIKAEGDHLLIVGDFTIHGVKRSISFPAQISESNEQIDLHAQFTIRQSDFKMQSARTTSDDVPVDVECRIGR